jgi:thioredoxin 1
MLPANNKFDLKEKHSMRKIILVPLLLCLALIALPVLGVVAKADQIGPAKGMVTMIDLGADRCIPCRMMKPILEEVRQEYEGKAAIIFIDVWKDPDAGRQFGIRAIPTQIFYDKDGKEVTRHTGFLGKEAIVAMLTKLGVGK